MPEGILIDELIHLLGTKNKCGSSARKEVPAHDHMEINDANRRVFGPHFVEVGNFFQ